jgi:hypothetical protein
VGKHKIVLFILAVTGNRNDMVDLQRIALEGQVNRFLTDKAHTVLPLQQALLQVVSLISRQL